MIYHMLLIFAAMADQVCKNRIESQEPQQFPRPMKKSRGRIMLYRNHNDGFPFGFLREYPKLVRTVPAMMTSLLAVVYLYLQRRPGKMPAKAALALTIGGSLSNLYDRYVRGYVIDYFSVQWGPLKKVVLNLGDACVFLGIGMLTALQLSIPPIIPPAAQHPSTVMERKSSGVVPREIIKETRNSTAK